MNPEEKLQQLCRRYGLPRSGAEDLLPLVERALGSPGTVGRCLMAVAEATLASRAADSSDRQQLREQLDDRTLVALAGVLHGWEPKD